MERDFSPCKKAKGLEAEGKGKKRTQYMHCKIHYLGGKKNEAKPRRSELKQQQVIPPWLYDGLSTKQSNYMILN